MEHFLFPVTRAEMQNESQCWMVGAALTWIDPGNEGRITTFTHVTWLRGQLWRSVMAGEYVPEQIF